MTKWIRYQELGVIVILFVGVNLVAVWAMDYFRTQIYLTGHRAPVCAIAFVGHDRVIATASGDKLRLFSADGGAPLREITGHSGRLTGLATFRGSQDIVTSSADGTILH